MKAIGAAARNGAGKLTVDLIPKWWPSDQKELREASHSRHHVASSSMSMSPGRCVSDNQRYVGK